MAEGDSAKTEVVKFDPEKTKVIDGPIKTMIWEKAPTGNVDDSIRERSAEFFRGDEVPAEIKAMGVLATELLVKTSKDLGAANLREAFDGKQLRTGDPTIYGMILFKDRLVLALTSVRDYGNLSVGLTSVPIDRLDGLTGGVAGELAQQKPDLAKTILSAEAGIVDKNLAKVDLMRFLAEKKPDKIKRISEMSGMWPNVGLVFTLDGENPLAKLYIAEIPNNEPVLGEAVKFYESLNQYRDEVCQLTKHDFEVMTTKKIEGVLSAIPEPLQRFLFNGSDPGNISWRALEFLEMFGYKGNEEQQKWRKFEQMSAAVTTVTKVLRGEILQSIQEGRTAEDVGLSQDKIDLAFREAFEKVNKKKLPDDFSLVDAVSHKTPLEELNI